MMQTKMQTMIFQKMILGLLAVLALFASSVSFAASREMPLPADKAFVFSASVGPADTVHVSWDMAPGYYIYKKRIHFNFEPALVTDVSLPQGSSKQVSRQPAEEVYYGKVSGTIMVHSQWKQAQLDVYYQGCSDRGFCYPPIHQLVNLNVATAASHITERPVMHGPINAPTSPSWEQNDAQLGLQSAAPLPMQSLLTHQNEVRELFAAPLTVPHLFVLLLIFMGLGVLLALTPCVLPMVPILASIILGQKQPVNLNKSLLLSAMYVLGSSLTYAMAGVAAALMGSSLQAWLQQPWIIALVSGLMILLSLPLFGVYDLHLPRRLQSSVTAISRKQKGGTYLGVFIMGMVSVLIVSPCVTAPLAGVLMYIAQTGNVFLGGVALFAMGIGMGVPLILLGISAGKWLPRRGPWMGFIQRGVGVLMLGMAVWLLTRVVSLSVILQLCGFFFLAAACYIAVKRARGHSRIDSEDSSKQVKQPQSYLILGLIGVLMMVTFQVPSIRNTLLSSTQASTTHSFVVVHNLNDLNQQLAAAKTLNKPVILDFYADWCESCVAMDKNVFSLPDVKKRLDRFILLRADLSANNAEDEALLKNYDVIAPPTILFFNDQGKEVNSHRIVGELSAQEFISRIQTFSSNCDKDMRC